MSVAIAAVGVAAVGGAYSSYQNGKNAQKQANASNAAAREQMRLEAAIAEAQLDFNKEQYEDWKEVYKPTQDQIAKYYENLTSDKFRTDNITSLEQEYTRSRNALDESLARRGITNSGIAVNDLTGLEAARMFGRAEIGASAEQSVMDAKTGFLSLGLGQQAGLQSGINQAYSNQVNMYGNRASQQLGQANMYQNMANQNKANVWNNLAGGISTGLNIQSLNQQNQFNQDYLKLLRGN